MYTLIQHTVIRERRSCPITVIELRFRSGVFILRRWLWAIYFRPSKLLQKMSTNEFLSAHNGWISEVACDVSRFCWQIVYRITDTYFTALLIVLKAFSLTSLKSILLFSEISCVRPYQWYHSYTDEVMSNKSNKRCQGGNSLLHAVYLFVTKEWHFGKGSQCIDDGITRWPNTQVSFGTFHPFWYETASLFGQEICLSTPILAVASDMQSATASHNP